MRTNLIKKIIRESKGFSLVELLIVVSLLILITSVVVPKYQTYSHKSQINSVKPVLSYIYNLLKMNYLEKGSFHNVKISNVSPPKGYCITIAIKSVDSKQPSPNFIGECGASTKKSVRRPASSSSAKSVQIKKPPSGFVIIAYGSEPYSDVGINHKELVVEGGTVKKNSNIFDMLTQGVTACKKYKERKDCQTAGCYWDIVKDKCEKP